MTSRTPTVNLVGTFVAVSIVTLVLAVLVARPRPGITAVRSTTVELDEPADGHQR